MEAVALARAGLSHLPVTACKGYFGHTLGAAGLIDVVISARCMEESVLLPVMGYEEHGVTESIRVQKSIERKVLHSCLKLAAGFGGNNAVLIIER
jgi:3-oxoacyl-[acyl-carrier-protein] synthase-1